MSTLVRRMVARYEADISDIRAKMTQLEAMHSDMERKTKAASRAIEDQTNKTMQAAQRMRMVYASVAGVVSTVMASAFVGLADQAQQVENQLRGIGIASQEAQKRVYALAIETRTPLESTVGLLRSLSNALKDQDYSQTMRQVGTLNRLLTVGGLDAGQRGSVVMQFGQALQSGVLSGDELRALRESAPYELLEAISKRAGGAVEDLRKFGEQGKITTAVMVGALNDLEQVSKDKFAAFNMTVGDSLTVFRTAMVGVAGEINKATGLTDNVSSIVAGLAGFMTDYAGAAATLASALMMVTQLAVVAAGARGLGAIVGIAAPVARAFTSVTNTAMIATVALTRLQGGLRGIVGLLGGPWGVAMTAAGAAVLLLVQSHESFADNIENTNAALERAGNANQKAAATAEELYTDYQRLEQVNKDIDKAISDQAITAEDTARREKRAIQERIEKNEELLTLQRALANDEIKEARGELGDAESILRGQARGELQRGRVNRANPFQPGVQRESITDAEADAWIEAQVAQIRLLNELTDEQKEFLENYRAMVDARKALQDRENELARTSILANGQHVRAYQSFVDDLAKAEKSALEGQRKRQAQLEELYKQRDLLQSGVRMNSTPQERMTRTSALNNVNEQIRSTQQAEARIDAVRAKFSALRAMMDDLGPEFDKSGTLRDLLTSVGTQLTDAEQSFRDATAAGTTMADIKLDNLEATIGRTADHAERLKASAEGFAAIGWAAVGDNFERLQGIMNQSKPFDTERKDPTFYAEEMARRRDEGDDEMGRIVKVAAYIAEELGTTTRAVLAVMNKESSLNPRAVGGANNEYQGLIQFGPNERRQYGVNANSSIEDQGAAALKFWKDRKFTPGMSDAQLYSTVLAGNPWDVHKGDVNNGGNVRNIQDEVTNRFGEHYARADAALMVYGDTAYEGREKHGKDKDAERDAERDREAAADKAKQDDEERAERRQKFLDSITDENTRIEYRNQLLGQTAEQEEFMLRVFDAQEEAKKAGISLDEEAFNSGMTWRDYIARREEEEWNKEKQRDVERKAMDEDRARRADELAKRQDFLNGLQDQLNQNIAQSIVQGDSLRDVFASWLEQLAQAYMMAALFNQGPMGDSGGGKGLIGGFTDWLTGRFADGGIMTSQGPVPLRTYSRGGIANKPQLALYGEGRTPEAYVPLPDGRSIPVTIKQPDVPSMQGGFGASSQQVGLRISLDTDLLKVQIEDTALPLAVQVANKRVDNFSRRELPQRVAGIRSDPNKRG